ncbi:MAG: hypothetical protein OXI87_11380 [Albidovulum sp.]|nr:hypothetical protein [Albidovulum sp.]
MFMMARHATTRDWFLDEAELNAAARDGRLPGVHLSRLLDRARSCRQIPKLVCMDEFHRCGDVPGIREQVVQDIREGRKHNIRISLASQMIDDFPDAVLELASGVFIFNAPSENAVRKLDEIYGLDELDRSILRGDLGGPSESGAPFWAIFRHKTGECRQRLRLTLGPSELWALSTTAEDAALRERLSELLGAKSARSVLASRFPGGSAIREIEARVARLVDSGECGSESARDGIVRRLARELETAFHRRSDSD